MNSSSRSRSPFGVVGNRATDTQEKELQKATLGNTILIPNNRAMTGFHTRGKSNEITCHTYLVKKRLAGEGVRFAVHETR